MKPRAAQPRAAEGEAADRQTFTAGEHRLPERRTEGGAAGRGMSAAFVARRLAGAPAPALTECGRGTQQVLPERATACRLALAGCTGFGSQKVFGLQVTISYLLLRNATDLGRCLVMLNVRHERQMTVPRHLSAR